ncbi:ArsR/SmtB family transcription factor [Flavobacterium sp.]|jgi:ArsR family transcriptional regulator|uniref:ArsR/SmtB family transcription factor n=1 Tax=Flavobacterium sp. TaxID=239 RepID=UPI0022BC1FB2|nr:metalloregulator ArsR/SmtB family transcription factor [Flavobacterium sp.]MCZ8143783.1 metalloregulator ArsR/SmtB family transcription factor [Flavobacterium sp.]MCZ8367430.1 metalloregulator ArsR/SmtB family transcription factor [Flavobacterium sp.]
MGVTKTEHFTEAQNAIAVQLKALAHPARIAIMEYLCEVNSCICGDIVNELPLSQPTISQHLKELKNAGLIKGTVEGTAICYCIDEKGMAQLQTYFNQFAARLQDKNQCC